MLMVDPCDHAEHPAISEMVSIVLRASQNLEAMSNPIIIAKFKTLDEETQFLRSLHQVLNNNKKSLYGTFLVVFQEKGILALDQCRYVSP